MFRRGIRVDVIDAPQRASVFANSYRRYSALEEFFTSRPEYNTKVFLAGQSYAGHYIPPLAAKLTERNSSVRLEGILLGNPDVAPEIQWRFYPEMARANRLIYEYKYARLKDNADECMGLVRECNREEVVVNKRRG
ncbi:hypothetical protein FOZ63_017556, partial [Perkinsus olseni]